MLHKEKKSPLQVRTVIYLAQNTACALEPETNCQGIFLRIINQRTQASFDLNHLCLCASIVDNFYSYKKKVALLSDQEGIYITLSSILYEWERQQPERDRMLVMLFNELVLQLSRSFCTHRQPHGIQLLSQAREYILQNYQHPLTIDGIAGAIGISRSYLSMLFANHMSRTLIEYIHAVRCDHAAFLLSTTHFSIIDIAVEVGFNNRQHFTRTFDRIYGMTPSNFRKTHTLDSRTPNKVEESA